MRKWYKPYVAEYDAIDTISADQYAQVNRKIRALQKSDDIDVTFVVVAYNEEKRIFASLHSLSELQTQYSVEVIVVNNNSTDRTAEIMERCGVVSVLEPEKGIGRARQAGLSRARGKYHLCADADTLYPPYYVDAMVRALNRKNAVVAFAPPSFIADGKKSALSLSIYEIFRDMVLRLRFIKRPELTIGAASLAFLTQPALAVGGWKTDIRRGTDGAMTMALKKVGRVVWVSDRRARIMTTSRTLDNDGTLIQMILLRLKREILRIGEYFTAKDRYEDQTDNRMQK